MSGADHGPVEPQHVAKMNALGQFLAEELNPGGKPYETIFVLLVTEVGEGGRLNYISNGERANMIEMLEEVLGRMKRHNAN